MPQCYQSIIIIAPIDRVWDTVNNLHDSYRIAGVIDRCEAVGDLGADFGAKRILNSVFHETLLECNQADYRIRYSINNGPSPLSPEKVKNYVSILQFRPATLIDATFVEWYSSIDATFVEWQSSWESQSEAASDFCNLIYVALLKLLKETGVVMI